MRRRTFFASAAGLALGTAAEPILGGRAVFFLDSLNDPVPHAHGWREHIQWLYQLGRPAADIYNLLVDHAHDLDVSVSRWYEPQVRAELFRAQALTLGDAGTVAFIDMGNHRASEKHLVAGARAAERSGDRLLKAHLLSKQVHRRIYDPEAGQRSILREALTIAGTAAQHAHGNAMVRADLEAKHAEVYAALGMERQAMTTLDRAGMLLEEATPADTPPWLRHYAPQRLHGMAAACWLRLGNARRALEESETALALTAADRGRVDADQVRAVIVLADGATGAARMGDPEQACALLERAIPTAGRAKSMLRTFRIRDARAALWPWAKERFVRDLDRQLALAGLG